ncbi:MAG: hypothetical protein KY451_08920 [Actinobacteria bacterium]|nr:hypothetical protein [Actinomycetota bacterium]
MADTLRARDADQLAAFARAARPVAAKAVQLTAGEAPTGMPTGWWSTGDARLWCSPA